MSWITPEELDFISENNRQAQKLEIRQYPIKSILTSLPFLSVIYSGIAGGFIDFTVIRVSFQNDFNRFKEYYIIIIFIFLFENLHQVCSRSILKWLLDQIC